MPERDISARHKQKSDTASNWASKNPILLEGELGFEADTGKIKIGNGVSSWSNLQYLAPGIASSNNTVENMVFLTQSEFEHLSSCNGFQKKTIYNLIDNNMPVKSWAPSQLSNPNILHNGDFRNPVNQRGLKVYASHTYGIDRWRSSTSVHITVSIENGGVRLTGKSSASLTNRWVQYVEYPQLYFGSTLTFSAIVDGELYSYTVTIPQNVIETVEFNSPFTVGSGNSDMHIVVSPTVLAVGFRPRANESILIQRVKLEPGTVSTIMNDPPMDYGKTLAVCQRYQVPLTNSRLLAWTTNSSNTIYLIFPVVTIMRILPAIEENGGTITIRHNSYTESYQMNRLQVYDQSGNGSIIFSIPNASSGIPPNTAAQASISLDGLALLNANL